jgi:hypothetical protein
MKKVILISVLLVIASLCFAQSNWLVDERTDIMYNSKRISFATSAAAGKNNYGRYPVLIVAYEAGELDLYIGWNEFITTDVETTVTTRFEDTSPIRENWVTSTTHTATFFSGSQVQRLRELMAKKSLFVNVVPYGNAPITVVFDLEGLSEELSKYPEITKLLK